MDQSSNVSGSITLYGLPDITVFDDCCSLQFVGNKVNITDNNLVELAIRSNGTNGTAQNQVLHLQLHIDSLIYRNDYLQNFQVYIYSTTSTIDIDGRILTT